MATLTVEGRGAPPQLRALVTAGSDHASPRYQQDLQSLIEELTAMRAAEARVLLDRRSRARRAPERAPVVRAERDGPGADGSLRRHAAGAARSGHQGWTIREDDEGIILDAPGRAAVRFDDPEAAKESIRRSFAFARDAQLREPSTLEFITTMERRGIDRLFASGTELATRLTAQGTAGIQPELQVIEPGARDETTGTLLQDVWRYARHFWSIPYQSTPGRNLFYLVRDAALPERPLIGIAALGQPGPRDGQAR